MNNVIAHFIINLAAFSPLTELNASPKFLHGMILKRNNN